MQEKIGSRNRLGANAKTSLAPAETGSLKTTLTPAQYRLSFEIARQIASDIVKDGLREGDFIGRESDMLDRYSISRDTYREALRVLEWQGLAHSRRGPNGGLVVAKPSGEAVVNILRDFFDLTGITLQEVTEVLSRLRKVISKLATIKLTEESIPSLQQLLEESTDPTSNLVQQILSEMRLRREIALIGGNSALSLFISPLDFVVVDLCYERFSANSDYLEPAITQSHTTLKAMINAIIENNDLEAMGHVDDYMAILDPLVEDDRKDAKKHSVYPHWFDSNYSKSAQELIYQIKQDIDANAYKIGDRFGSEVELIEKYGVSRSIFREASRILEFIGITESRKGRDGGLIVSEVNTTNIIKAVSLFLEQSNMPFDQVYEARLILDTFAVELAAQRSTPKQIEKLKQLLELERNAETIDEFIVAATNAHSAICQASGNRVIGLYIDILIHSKLFQPVSDNQLKYLYKNKIWIARSHERIIRDIEAKNPKAASRHMRNHRAQMASYLKI